MIFKNKELEQRLEQLNDEVVLGMKLEKITKIVSKSPERHWLGEILDNILSLYYVTMWTEWPSVEKVAKAEDYNEKKKVNEARVKQEAPTR